MAEKSVRECDTASVIEFDQMSVAFSGRHVLNEVCLAIPRGGLTVFVGPNGAGKTTLLLSIMGEVPHTGDIRFAAGVRGHIGYVPQHLEAQTSTPITCEEFLALTAGRRPLWLGIGREGRRAAGEALARVGMASAARRCISELSGGEMRRVLLASALLRQPVLLLLDEPAAGVDLKGERLFWDILNELREQDAISIVMVSHNLTLAAHYATHVVCVHDGICQQGTPHQIFTAGNLMSVFGIPIHIYPDQCALPQHLCPKCGAISECGMMHPCGAQHSTACQCDQSQAGGVQ